MPRFARVSSLLLAALILLAVACGGNGGAGTTTTTDRRSSDTTEADTPTGGDTSTTERTVPADTAGPSRPPGRATTTEPGTTPTIPSGPPSTLASGDPDEHEDGAGRASKGEFAALPAGAGLTIRGGASMVRLPDGDTLLNVDMGGLEAGQTYDVYVHVLPCAESEGGDRYRLDPSQPAEGSNALGSAATADDQGRFVELSLKLHGVNAGPEARTVVVSQGSTRVACADLVSR